MHLKYNEALEQQNNLIQVKEEDSKLRSNYPQKCEKVKTLSARYPLVTSFTSSANIPNKEDPLSARSTLGGIPGGTLLINNPYKPIPNINITVPAR